MVPFFCREQLPKSVEKVILLKKCLKLIDVSVEFFLEVPSPESQKRPILNFWFSACRRKIARGFRIWPYFSNFSRKSSQKRWFIARYGFISILLEMEKLVINPCFWPLLLQKMKKIRSDSKSSCNFASTCTKPKIKNQFFRWCRGQYF